MVAGSASAGRQLLPLHKQDNQLLQCSAVPPLHSCSLVRMAEVEWHGDEDLYKDDVQNDYQDGDVGVHYCLNVASAASSVSFSFAE